MTAGLNPPRRSLPALATYVALPLALAAGVFWVAYDGGTYGLTSRGSAALVVLWVLALAVSLSVWPLAPLPLAAVVGGGFLAAFAAWVGLSAFWAASAEKAFNEFDRAILYLALFALAVAVAGRGTARRWCGGLAVGLTAVGLLALSSRLFPNAFAAPKQLAQVFPAAERRLSYPVDYWNGLALLVAYALPLLLYFAVHARTLLLRGLALAPVPALVGTIYLTSSRGGSIAAVLATFVFVVFAGRPFAAAGALLAGGAGAAGVVALLVSRPELVDHPHEASQAVGQGQSAAIFIALICVAVGVAYALLARVVPSPRLGRGGTAVLAGLLIVLVVVGLIAARPVHRFQQFKEVPPGLGTESVGRHLFSGSGNGRWQLWQAAVEEFKTRPVAGRGAGSYEAWWAEHGNLPLFVRDGHSLYLETLGELGIVGLLLLLAFFATVVAVGFRRLLASAGSERSVVAALLAIMAAFLFQAGVDWMWELTATGAVMALAAGLLTGPATLAIEPGELEEARSEKRAAVRFLRAGAVAIAMGLAVGEAIPLLASMEVRRSEDAAARGDFEAALSHARGAESLQPWAASPHLQSALVYEQAGDLQAAIRALQPALERDDSDWRLWLVDARLETKAGQIEQALASLERARALNPRSPLFASE